MPLNGFERRKQLIERRRFGRFILVREGEDQVHGDDDLELRPQRGGGRLTRV